MVGQDDKDAPRGSNAVLSWYDNTRPIFIDLVGDYAGKELFLVEGDSLLRVCFEDERIDFQGKPPCAPSDLHSSLGLSLAA
jgi:ATP-dependent RNA helicase DDX60